MEKKFTEAYNFHNQTLMAIFRGHLNDIKTNYGSGDFNELGLLGFLNYDEYGGDQNTNLLTGYRALINYLETQSFGNNLQVNQFIRRNRQVINIGGWDSSKVSVSLRATNRNQERAYYADFVINTLPLGVMKEHLSTLFSPQVPRPKFNAIKFIGKTKIF